MKNFAFIFARGGSKGLPKKNIKLLAGKPLIQYSIDVALAAPSINRVFVSTDDDEIAQVAANGGATVIKRPDELASDTSPEILSWKHAIEHVQEEYGDFDGFVSLPATSPLRLVQDVERVVAKRVETGSELCIAISPASRSPYFNMVKYAEDGSVELVIQPDSDVSRRQDAPQVFDITTMVYATTPAYVLRTERLFDTRVTSIEVPKERAVDIDDIYDFLFAETLLREQVNEY
ncbi:acylneuraminate cytidylyltransferase family protein [Vibrio penaeicida]|uniref:acylneuraminate cytidylyltransferase family protein n=1 Tax=Vibrio penaeicida TaxID=104609 RepID=UPI000CEA0BE2|nr:acylneuraminate cytidylyltransferase family protein [Vibrio penaeicida]